MEPPTYNQIRSFLVWRLFESSTYNFQNFNFKKFVVNTGSLYLVYIFRMQKILFTGIFSNFQSKFTFKMCVNLIACFEIISVKS